VYGRSNTSYGVYGTSETRYGVYGYSNDSDGVVGETSGRAGTRGVVGHSDNGAGVLGFSDYGSALVGLSPNGNAAALHGTVIMDEGAVYIIGPVNMGGPVYIRGPLTKPGGSFKIDHPLDPANKYLSHSFVESPDMKNIYDGVVVLDDKGEAEIELPDWFGALNKDFRYQLTAIGAPAPNLHISEEISSDGVIIGYGGNTSSSSNGCCNNNRFKIAGGTPGMKVSWQVTGIRKDPWANAHRIRVEEDKPDKERGYYIYPELYGQPEEKGISHLLFPKEEKKELHINEQNKRPKRKIPSS
jgi:hypothetical protein